MSQNIKKILLVRALYTLAATPGDRRVLEARILEMIKVGDEES